MNELVTVQNYEINGEKQPGVDARELHYFLEVETPFSMWIKRRIEEAQFIEKQDFEVIHKNVKALPGASAKVDYVLALDAAKHVALLERTTKGREIRIYFIECEKKLNTPPTIKEVVQKMSNDKKLKEAVSAFDALHRYAKKIGLKGMEAVNHANFGVLQEYGVDLAKLTGIRLIEEHEPKESKESLNPTNIGERLNWGTGKSVAKKVNLALLSLGLQERVPYIGSNGKKKWEWQVTPEGEIHSNHEHFVPEHGKKALKRILWKPSVLSILKNDAIEN